MSKDRQPRLSRGIVTSEIVDKIPVDSERWFASAFLRFFGKNVPLHYQPPEISLEDLGSTTADFLIKSGVMDLLVEVTKTRYTRDSDRKPVQYKIREAYRKNINPEARHLEINGGALECMNWLMGIINGVLSGNIKLYKAQKMINRLGWDDQYLEKIKAQFTQPQE